MIDDLLRHVWSATQIPIWLKQHTRMRASDEWNYRHILPDKHAGCGLHRHLSCCSHRKCPNPVTVIIEGSIAASHRYLATYGDYGAAGVARRLGNGHTHTQRGRYTLVTLTKRKHRITLLKNVERKSAELGTQAIDSGLYSP